MSDRYAVINIADQVIENIILWDGVQPYDPGSDYALILEADALEQGLQRRPELEH